MTDLVFLHGGGDSAAVWDGQVAHFSSTANVCALDLPGHGSRLAERAHDSHVQNAIEVVAEIHRRGLQRPVLIGHSMGGAVVLRLALDYSEVPGALVLIATGARMRMRPDFLETARQRAETLPAHQAVGVTVHVADAVSPACPDGIRRWIQEHTGRATAQAVYADFLSNDRFDVMNDLGRIEHPTLVIGGSDDKLTPPKFLTYLGEHIPRARLELVPQAGHYVFVEQAEAFNRALSAFLANLERS